MDKFLEVLSVAATGMGTVFIGLICLVGVCKLIGFIGIKKKDAVPQEIPNRQELLAAVAAAVAEELGEDVRAIRITSIRRI